MVAFGEFIRSENITTQTRSTTRTRVTINSRSFEVRASFELAELSEPNRALGALAAMCVPAHTRKLHLSSFFSHGTPCSFVPRASSWQLEKATGTSGLRLRFSEHNAQVDTNITKLCLWGIARILLGK